MTLCKIGRKIKREKSKLGQYQENPSGLADIYGQGGKTLRYICYPVYQLITLSCMCMCEVK